MTDDRHDMRCWPSHRIYREVDYAGGSAPRPMYIAISYFNNKQLAMRELIRPASLGQARWCLRHFSAQPVPYLEDALAARTHARHTHDGYTPITPPPRRARHSSISRTSPHAAVGKCQRL